MQQPQRQRQFLPSPRLTGSVENVSLPHRDFHQVLVTTDYSEAQKAIEACSVQQQRVHLQRSQPFATPR